METEESREQLFGDMVRFEFPCPENLGSYIRPRPVGVVAQLVERLVRNEKVRSSILLNSTIPTPAGMSRRGSNSKGRLHSLINPIGCE